MRSPSAEEYAQDPSIKSKTTIRSYTSMLKQRMTKRSEANARLKQAKVKSEAHYQADNASLLPRPSDVGTVASTTSRSRYRVRRDIQSHIPDWIDDVVHARLMEIAERLTQEATDAGAEEVWSPGLPPETEDQDAQSEEARPGSAPEALREESYRQTQDIAKPRRSSVSAPSTRSLSLNPGARSIVSPVDTVESPIVPPTIEEICQLSQVPGGEVQVIRHSRNLSSISGGTALSHGTHTSIYSKQSSTSSPGTSVEKRMSDALSTRMTWKDIARKTPIKKPVEAGVLQKVNTHLAKPSTCYSIMSPVNAGVFDEPQSPHMANPNNRYTVMSPVRAGVFDETASNLNKPLPPDPTRQDNQQQTTFFVMGDIVHSPPVPKSPELLRSVTFPVSPRLQSPKHTPSPRSPKSAGHLVASPLGNSLQLPQSAELPRPQTMSSADSFTAKKFARLSRPFSEPVFGFSDVPALPGEESESEDANPQFVELSEKFMVILEENEDDDDENRGDAIGKEQCVLPITMDARTPGPDSPAAEQINTHVSSVVSPAPPKSRSQKSTARSPTPTPGSPGLSGRGSPALSVVRPIATQDQAVSAPDSSELHVVNQPTATPTIAINFVSSPPVEEPVDMPQEFAKTLEHAEFKQGEEADETHEESDEHDEAHLSEPLSPTLSQAEEDLMATLAMDTAHKFVRPNSWLADSPTLGKPGLPSLLHVVEEEVRPATALGNEVHPEDVKIRKKTESHYAFLWSPENGWYVS